MRILHYIPDDKFLDDEFYVFEKYAPRCNDWYLWNRGSVSELCYIKSIDRISGFAPAGSEAFRTLIDRCQTGHYDAVIIHACPPKRLVYAFNKTPALVFLCTWGGDVYEMTNTPLLMPITRAAFLAKQTSQSYLEKTMSVLRFIKRMGVMISEVFGGISDAYLCVDYICPVIDEDYNVLRRRYGCRLKASMLPFSYGRDNEDNWVGTVRQRDEIVVGNSETWTGNHLDVFHKLKILGVDMRIVCPLSYGVNPYLQELIVREGRTLFGALFDPITKFLPYAEYCQRVESARYMVMGHLRQQAVGNVVIGLRSGVKIYFFGKSPVYRYLKGLGANVYSLDECDSAEDFMKPLSLEEKQINREIWQSVWGREAIIAKVKRLLDIIRSRAR